MQESYHLDNEIALWAEACSETPDDAFIIFRKFLKHYCSDMLDEAFVSEFWAE